MATRKAKPAAVRSVERVIQERDRLRSENTALRAEIERFRRALARTAATLCVGAEIQYPPVKEKP